MGENIPIRPVSMLAREYQQLGRMERLEKGSTTARMVIEQRRSFNDWTGASAAPEWQYGVSKQAIYVSAMLTNHAREENKILLNWAKA